MKKSGKYASKRMDWYRLNQRFSIRKYHFGATSVLLGTALFAGGQAQVQADELTEPVSDSSVLVPHEQGQLPQEVQVPPTSTQSQAVTEDSSQDSLDNAQTAPVGPTGTTEGASADFVASSESEVSSHFSESSPRVESGQELYPKASQASNQESIGQQAQSESPVIEISPEVQTVHPDLASVADQESVVSAEPAAPSLPSSQTSDQTSLERQSSQATFSNQSAQLAAQAALKKETSPQSAQNLGAMAAAVVDLRRQGRLSQEQAKDLMMAYSVGNWTPDTLAQVLESYGINPSDIPSDSGPKSVASASLQPLNLPQKTVVANLKDLSQAELAAITHEILVANPQLTTANTELAEGLRDRIEVTAHTDGSGHEAGDVTVTYIDQTTGQSMGSQSLNAREVILSQAALANQDQLTQSINWFSLSKATRHYKDGSVAYPDGSVIYSDGSKGTTQDQRFQTEVAKFVPWDSDPSGKTYEALQEGMVLDIPTTIDGYELTAQVVKLAPRDVATDPVRDLLGQASNTTRLYPKDDALAAQGQANNQVYRGNDSTYQAAAPADIILVPQDARWSQLARAGLAPQGTSDDADAGLLAFSSNKNDANVGVTLAFTATYKGQPVPANVIVADAEEAGLGELLQFETDGTPWQAYTTVFSGANPAASTVKAMTASDLAVPDNSIINSFQNAGYKADEWVTTDANGQPIVYGSQYFGPLYTKIGENPVAVAMSKDVSTLSIYINAYGMQSAMIGFVAEDLGDAPASYGKASHVLGNWSDNLAGNSPLIHSQPYLGRQAADADFDTGQQSGDTSFDDHENDADEGENQLVSAGYTLRQSSDTSYTLKGVYANPGQNNSQAYARAWADFNNNGQFDADEASDLITISQDGIYDFTFSQVPQNWDSSQEKMVMRIRIGLNEKEILSPTGRAATGEVEDFQVDVQQAPRGHQAESTGLKNQVQTAKVGFSAYGKTLSSNFQTSNYMDTSRPAKIVLADGQLVDTYSEPGQGTYDIKGWDGDQVLVEFTPEANFMGTATGVVIRAWDGNQADTGWRVSATTQTTFPSATNQNQGLNGSPSMDAVYIPQVTDVERDRVSRTIRYRYQDGSPVQADWASDQSQSVTFERPIHKTADGTIVADGDWQVSQGQPDLPAVTVPVLEGYLADRSQIPARTLVAGEADVSELITYRKLGNYLPQAPAGVLPIPAIPYPNDSRDASKPGTPSSPIPTVPGYTPLDSTGQPLSMVDPSDPSQGYQPPALPADPSQDTLITYEANDSRIQVRYQDENGRDLLPSQTLTGKVGQTYTTSAPVINGYLLSAYPTNSRGSFGQTEQTVTYVYREIGAYRIYVPGQGIMVIRYPNDPNDPTKLLSPSDPSYPRIPYVIGYIPVDPKTGLPLTPFSSGDVTQGYVPPAPSDPSQDTEITYVQHVPANPSDPGEMINPGTPSDEGRKRRPQTPDQEASGQGQLTQEDQQVITQDAKVLPKTGEASDQTFLAGVLALLTASLVSAKRRRRKED